MTRLPPSVRPSVRPSTRPSSLPRRTAGSDGERSRGKCPAPPLHLSGISSLPLSVSRSPSLPAPAPIFVLSPRFQTPVVVRGWRGGKLGVFFQPLLQKIFFSLSWKPGGSEPASRRQRDPGWVFPAGQGVAGAVPRCAPPAARAQAAAGSAPGVTTGGAQRHPQLLYPSEHPHPVLSAPSASSASPRVLAPLTVSHSPRGPTRLNSPPGAPRALSWRGPLGKKEAQPHTAAGKETPEPRAPPAGGAARAGRGSGGSRGPRPCPSASFAH